MHDSTCPQTSRHVFSGLRAPLVSHSLKMKEAPRRPTLSVLEPMNVIAERTFVNDDQIAFAALSGDANPLHMDPLTARRTLFGGQVVHGVHLVLWALEGFFSNRMRGKSALTRLSAQFNRGVLLGQTVQLTVEPEGDELVFRIRRGDCVTTYMRVSFGSPLEYSELLPKPEPQPCREQTFHSASEATGVLPLEWCDESATALFPHASAALPPVQLAGLLATTRLVGMECPGLHSLYTGFDMKFDAEASGAPEMSFLVDRASPHSGMLRLAVSGPGFHGKLRAFLRPKPCHQAGMAELAGLVSDGEFAGQRAIVIGGSRGLGEVAAKLLSLGGASVIITYHVGEDDAKAVADTIKAAGGACDTAPFNVMRPDVTPALQPANYLYYFATPAISSDGTGFSSSLFAQYSRYYVSGFAETLLGFAQGAQPLHVLYPSTVFLNDPAQMPEYCAAKAAGEELCRQFAARFPEWRMHVPRLPRLFTDQTNGFSQDKPVSPEIVMLQELRTMMRQEANAEQGSGGS